MQYTYNNSCTIPPKTPKNGLGTYAIWPKVTVYELCLNGNIDCVVHLFIPFFDISINMQIQNINNNKFFECIMKQFMNMNPSIEEFNILLTYYLPLYVSQSQNNNEVFCSTYLCKILTTEIENCLILA